MEAAAYPDLSSSEWPDFVGRAVAALARDPDVLRHSGRVLVAVVARTSGSVRDARASLSRMNDVQSLVAQNRQADVCLATLLM